MLMTKRLKWIARGILTTAVMFVVAACSAGGGTTEVEMSEFAIDANPSSLSAGEIIFDTTNAGDFPHEMVIARTDLAADAMASVVRPCCFSAVPRLKCTTASSGFNAIARR